MINKYKKYVVCTLIRFLNVKLLQYKSIFKNFNVRCQKTFVFFLSIYSTNIFIFIKCNLYKNIFNI